MNYLAEQHTDIALAVLEFIHEYSRWDNLLVLLDCNNADVSNAVLKIVKAQFNEDINNMKANKPISLLAKWLYSENASSEDTKRRATIIRDYIGLTPHNYRKALSYLRSYLNVVECQMSAKEWENINYSVVPSKANIKYSKAFMRNDEERRKAYLESLKKGETKINAGVLFPHDVVHKYSKRYYTNSYDEALEQMWKSLKNIGNIENTIVVADGSGSMTLTVDNNSSVSALQIANALAIYCGERCNGEFKDKYITFSERPQLVDMTQDEIPQNILILSDMEFNMCATSNSGRVNATLFDTIANKYAQYGYKLPRLVFWNLASRTGTIPVKQNDMGVSLVSGFSVNILNMVMNGEIDPYKNLIKTLNSERYSPVEKAIINLM